MSEQPNPDEILTEEQHLELLKRLKEFQRVDLGAMVAEIMEDYEPKPQQPFGRKIVGFAQSEQEEE